MRKIKVVATIVLMMVCIFLVEGREVHAGNTSAKEVVVGISYNTLTYNYRKSVEEAGGIPKLLGLVSTEKEAREILADVDALIITGGVDIDPSWYGEAPSKYLEETDLTRDVSDMILLGTAMEMDLPVLCVCRGMQLLNVMQGGSLYQDISTQYETELWHRDAETEKGVKHKIQIIQDTMIAEIVGKTSISVYSLHHQAIKDLGEDLIVTANSADGLIEAVELSGEDFVLGVQFHPEKYAYCGDTAALSLFEMLCAKGRAYREERESELTAPSQCRIKLTAHDDVKISWGKVDGAYGYTVYYKKSYEDTYSYHGTTKKLSYQACNLTDGVKYTFKVVPYCKKEGMFYKGAKGSMASIYTLKKMSAPAVKKYSDTKATVTWEDLQGETGYQISRSTSKTGTANLVKCTTTNAVKKIVGSGTKCRTYYYKVRAYVQTDSETIYGPWSQTTSFKNNLPAPKEISAALYGHDEVKVTWSKVAGATGYAVYYKKAAAKNYTFLKRTRTLSATKEDLIDGAKYVFKIVPYCKYDGKFYNSRSFRTASVYTLKKVVLTEVKKPASKKITVKWENINGETGYQISRSTSAKGTANIQTYRGVNLKMKTFSIPYAKKYYYKVRAYKVENGEKVYGPWSAAIYK